MSSFAAFTDPVAEPETKILMRDIGIEFLATTLFVYCGTGGAVAMQFSNDTSIVLPIAMCFGITITFMAYSMGHLTGGHMNPAVSALMFFKRQISLTKFLGYSIAQLLGAMLASSLVMASVSELEGVLLEGAQAEITSPPYLLGINTVHEHLSDFNGFMLEFMGSFIFYFVIAQTALDKRGIATTGFPALPIGLSLVIVHVCLIPFTGCGVNPARTFGPAVMTCIFSKTHCGTAIDSNWWVYWAGPYLAAFLVAEITSLMNCDECESNKQQEETNVKIVDSVDDEGANA